MIEGSQPTPEMPLPWIQRLENAARTRSRIHRHRSIQVPTGLDFCSNDYLGLRKDPRLAQAAFQAASEWGSGSGAARLLRGTCPLHDHLETVLAQWKGAESCLLFNTGFQCNSTVIPSLLETDDAVFSDALNHASLVDGCRMARSKGARLTVYRHRDLSDLETKLASWRTRALEESLALVVTDAVFSMDGDTADLPGLLKLCQKYQAILLVDEAHATGLLGENAGGLAELQGVRGQIPLVMGTLGKALGSFGAFMACNAVIREHLVNTCRGFIFSTALPPGVVASSLEGIKLAKLERWRREKALGYANLLRQKLDMEGASSAIVPVLLGEDQKALEVSRAMQVEGFDVRAVRPPSVPEGQARLRITTGAHLEEDQVHKLVDVLKKAL